MAFSGGRALAHVLIMGVCGTGKSSVGGLLAERMKTGLVEADDYHSPEARRRMSEGVPLTDADRWGWLDRIAAAAAVSEDTVIACSALKRTYRERLAARLGGDLIIVHLAGSPSLVAERMAGREGHFMPTSLIDSQFADLEPPQGDDVLTIDIKRSAEDIVEAIHSFANGTTQNA